MDLVRKLIESSYVASAPIKAFNNVPRFGHTSDIASIYSNNAIDFEVVNDYLQGTVFVAGFCLAGFIVWIIAILITKLLGKRAGVAAGRPLEIDSPTDETPRKHVCLRSFMLSSSIIILISGLVFLIMGARSVGQVFLDVSDGSAGLSNIASDIVNVTDEVIAFGLNTGPLKDDMVTQLQLKVCTSDGAQGIADEFDSGATSVVEVLTTLQDFSKNELTNLRDTFEVEFGEFSSEMDNAFESGERWAEPMFVALPMFLFGLILAIGSYLAWKGPYIKLYFTLQSWIILPIFFLVVVLMAFVLALTGTLLVINSDVCLGGESKTPEGFVENVLSRNGVGGDVMSATKYYIIDGCRGEYERMKDVESLIAELNEGVAGIDDLRTLLSTDSQTIINICGATQERLDELDGLFNQTFDAFTDFVALAERNLAVLKCDRINNIFVDFYHDALCTSGPYSLMWIFATMMAVYILGMAMILLRGALYPTNVNYDDAEYRGVENHDMKNAKNSEGLGEDVYLNDVAKRGSETDEASRDRDKRDSEESSNDEELTYGDDNESISYSSYCSTNNSSKISES